MYMAARVPAPGGWALPECPWPLTRAATPNRPRSAAATSMAAACQTAWGNRPAACAAPSTRGPRAQRCAPGPRA